MSRREITRCSCYWSRTLADWVVCDYCLSGGDTTESTDNDKEQDKGKK